MTGDESSSAWFEGDEPPRAEMSEPEAGEGVEVNWFRGQAFRPTPQGESPSPDRDIELTWQRGETGNSIGMPVSSVGDAPTDGTKPAGADDDTGSAAGGTAEPLDDEEAPVDAAAADGSSPETPKSAETTGEQPAGESADEQRHTAETDQPNNGTAGVADDSPENVTADAGSRGTDAESESEFDWGAEHATEPTQSPTESDDEQFTRSPTESDDEQFTRSPTESDDEQFTRSPTESDDEQFTRSTVEPAGVSGGGDESTERGEGDDGTSDSPGLLSKVRFFIRSKLK